MNWITILSVVVACQCAVLPAVDGYWHRDEQTPCELDWDMSPCTCYGNGSLCKEVTQQQFAKVFTSPKTARLLKGFCLYYCEMETVPASLFSEASLETVIIRNSRVTTIDKELFQGSKLTLTSLSVVGSQIGSLPSFSEFENLADFTIVNSRIGNLAAGCGKGQSCYWKNNAFSTVERYAFANATDGVRLRGNMLGSVSDFAFHNVGGGVDLSNTWTSEKSFSSKAFSGMRCQVSLDLSRNKFATIPQDLFDSFVQTCVDQKDSRLTINLEGNPIECDKSLTWFAEKPAEFKAAFSFSFPNGKNIRNITTEDLQ